MADSRFNYLAVTVIALLAAVSFLPHGAEAAVAFNTFPISFTPTTNNDLPLLDARNATAGGAFSASQTDHDNGVPANAGEEIEFQIYYHNTGVADDQAANVTIRATLPGGTRTDHAVSASISADNATTVTSHDTNFNRGGDMIIHINGQPQTLEFIPGSVRWFPNHSTTPQTTGSGDSLVTAAGLNIGTVRGCFEFSGFVNFRARVGAAAAANYDLGITKRVLNVSRGETTYQSSTNASPGERVRFEVRATTSGNASQSNVIVRDVIPTSQLNLVGGTLLLNGANVSNMEADFLGSGRNIGSRSPGSTDVFVFDALVAGSGAFSGTITTVTNTANVRSDQVGTRQAQAQVNVQLAQNVQFQQRKTAFNLTQGVDATSIAANPGDSIVYTLYFKNTGAAQLSGIIIEDNIQDILQLAQITDQGGAVSVNGSIKYASVDIPVGVEVSRSFTVRVRNPSEFPAGHDSVMTNIYGNEVRILVRVPAVAAAAIQAQPPRTGPGEWLMTLLAGLTTMSYWLYRKQKTV
ncbi:MAG: DUF11 domain-containing protein [Candidatus Doudnabacteria bacterium]|nr:DUF11 domain-containing protein [Candidatus Doudnabacteria bacterium]